MPDTASRPPFFEIACDATFGDVRVVLKQLDMRLAAHGVDDDSRGSVQIVLAEAMNNIVEHAYADTGRSGAFALSITARSSGLDVTLSDGGAPMPWGQLSKRLTARRPLAPEFAEEGGFGWPIINSLAADIRYDRVDGRNVLEFLVAAPDIDARSAGARRRDAYLFGQGLPGN